MLLWWSTENHWTGLVSNCTNEISQNDYNIDEKDLAIGKRWIFVLAKYWKSLSGTSLVIMAINYYCAVSTATCDMKIHRHYIKQLHVLFDRCTNGIWRSQQYSPDVEDNKDTMEPVNSNCDHSTIMLSVHPMLSTWQPNVQRLFVYNNATQVIYI